MVNTEKLLKAISKSRYNKIGDGNNGYYYASDSHFLFKFPAIDGLENVGPAGVVTPSAANCDKILQYANDKKPLIITRKQVREYIASKKTDPFFKEEGNPWFITDKIMVNARLMQVFFDVTGVKEAVFLISDNPFGTIHAEVDGIYFALAPMQHDGKRTSDKIREKLEKAVEEKDFYTILDMISPNNNKISITIMSNIVGQKLEKSQIKRIKQVRAYFGEAWMAWENAEEKARQEKIQEKQKKEKQDREDNVKAITEKFNGNNRITGKEFVTLCDWYGVKMHLRTRGFCLNSLSAIRKDRHYWYLSGTKSGKVWEVFDELLKAMEG